MPQTGYHHKARVKAECYGDPTLLSDYTPYLDTYLEPIPVPEYECGKVFEDREITNLELKHTFAPGEIVESKNGDTRYEIIFSEEKNGYLSGQFFMIMDCWGGAKIRCEFSKTQINTDNIVLKTIFHNVPDSTLYVKPETIRKENTLIQGKNGEELVLTKKGQVMGKSEFNATGGNSVLLKEYHRKSDSLAQWQINFSPDTKNQTYAFDHIGSGNHGIFSGADYYPQSGSYDFRYKSVECGKNDKVIVEFGSYPQADSVVFKDKYGVTYPISSKDNVLSFTGVSKADTNYIYAYRGDKKIGKLFLNTYKRQTKYIELVSVNGGTIDKTITAEGLSKIFNCAVVDFKIESKKLDIPDLKTFTHGGSSWHSVCNDDQKKVLEAYDSLMKDDKFYLFFVDNVLNKKDSLGTSVSGYMPRGYNGGFIYEGGSLHTVAHELGHGIGNLEHVFENSSNSGKTKNLMDYSFEKDAEQLWHFQWDQIQDPSRVWMKWNKDEGEGENVEDIIIPRTNWRLVIYSPDVSKHFLKAYEKNDYYEMRRITYYSLFHEFVDENKDWWKKQEKFGGQSLRPNGYSIAQLDYFEDAKEGMTVILSTYDKNMNIVFNPKVLYFKPFYSWTKYTPIFLLDVEEPITQTFEGICYPVDINWYDKKSKSLGGKEFYGDDDFVGVEVSLVGMTGITFDKVFDKEPPFWKELLGALGIGNGVGISILYGSMKGYGVCIYQSYIQWAAGLDVGISVSKADVYGKISNSIKEQPKYWSLEDNYYGPKSMEGYSRSFNAAIMFNNYAHWEGFLLDGTVLWDGVNTGVTGGVPFNAGFNISRENSKLVPLNFIFNNYQDDRK